MDTRVTAGSNSSTDIKSLRELRVGDLCRTIATTSVNSVEDSRSRISRIPSGEVFMIIEEAAPYVGGMSIMILYGERQYSICFSRFGVVNNFIERVKHNG